MATQAERAEHFLALHQSAAPLLMPNPWDLGSAKVLAALGFEALATTSVGYAATLGRLDGLVARDEAVAHAAAVVAAVDIPVSADFENCFVHEPSGVAETIELGIGAGLAGCSIEDWDGEAIYDVGLATERVAAAARSPTAALCSLSSRVGPRTTSTAGMTWPTRSPGCSVTRRQVQTCSSLRA